jgi:Flp pilus assembly protein TadB
MALILAGLPLVLWLVLFAVNPTYPTRLLTEACGVAMVVAIFVCVSIGYIALLGSFALANRLEPPSWLVHKKTAL